MITEMQRASWAITAGASMAMLCPSYEFAEDANAQTYVYDSSRQIASAGRTVPAVRHEIVSHAIAVSSFSAATAERPTRTARLAAVWSRIQSYATLEPDWAGSNTEAPSTVTISHARHILAALPHTVDVPLVAASGDGEIVFTWLVGHDRIEASIDDEGYLSWACRVSGVVFAGDSIDLATQSSTTFTQLLVSHYA